MKASILFFEALFFSLGIIFSSPFSYGQNNCSDLDDLKRSRSERPDKTSTMQAWSSYQDKIYSSKTKLAYNIFNSYLQGKLSANFFDDCFTADQENQEFQELLPSIFLEESLKKLKLGQSSSIKKFNEMVDLRISNNNFILFRLAGHYKGEAAPTELPGGFHRGQGSIFMNFTKIPPNEWLIILIHELTHSLDLQLSDAISEYSKNENVISAARSKKALAEMKSDENTELYRWLRAGLDRGFLAEYRAWVVTFKIYQDGVKEGLWQPIFWMENILSQKAPQEDLSSFTFRYLDPRFTNPTEWPFQTSPVKEALENLRTHLRKTTTPRPSLRNLEIILK